MVRTVGENVQLKVIKDVWKSNDIRHNFSLSLQPEYFRCKVSTPDTEEAKLYLQCALQMNPAHALFWKCLQQLDPSLIIEDPNASNATAVQPNPNPAVSSPTF